MSLKDRTITDELGQQLVSYLEDQLKHVGDALANPNLDETGKLLMLMIILSSGPKRIGDRLASRAEELLGPAPRGNAPGP